VILAHSSPAPFAAAANMRAIRRARRSRAACRAAASIRSRGIGASRGSGGGSGGSRNARLSCTVALLLRRRSDGSAAESVEEMAQPKQIAMVAKDAPAGAVIGHVRTPPLRSSSQSVHWAGISARLPSGRQASAKSTPSRRILPITGSARPSKGWRSGVIVTESGNPGDG
jgi:hypothetical protein